MKIRDSGLKEQTDSHIVVVVGVLLDVDRTVGLLGKFRISLAEHVSSTVCFTHGIIIINILFIWFVDLFIDR